MRSHELEWLGLGTLQAGARHGQPPSRPAAATECQHVGLAEALELTFLILAKEPSRFRALRSAGTLATAATTVDQKTPMATPPATTTAMTAGTDTVNAPPLQRHCAIRRDGRGLPLRQVVAAAVHPQAPRTPARVRAGG